MMIVQPSREIVRPSFDDVMRCSPLGAGLALARPPKILGTPFNPTKITNCIAWYRGDLGITLNTGHVSAWADQSGRGDANENTAQGTGANQPTYNASNGTYNSQATVDFDAVNDTLVSGVWATACTRTTTIIVVGNSAGSTEHTAIDGVTNGFRYLISQFNATTTSMFAGSQPTGTFAWATKNGVIGEFNTNGGGIDGTLYGGDFTTPVFTNNNVGNNNLTQLSVGSQNGGGSSFWNGSIAEIVFYSRALIQSERNQLRDYFNARYTLSIV